MTTNDIGEKMGFFDKLRNTLALIKDKAQLYRMIVDAVRDGELTDDEILQIQDRIREIGNFSESEMKTLRATVYEVAYRAVSADKRITEREEADLLRIRTYFDIPDSVVEPTKKELAKYRLMENIDQGALPVVEVPELVKERDEVAHWATAASLLEEKTVNLGYKGGTQGLNVKISKSITYRVAAQKGTLVTEQRMVPVSDGRFLVTNRRFVFNGKSKAFTIWLGDVSAVKYYTDGIGITDKKDNVRVVKFSLGDADLIGMVASRLLSKLSLG